MLVPTWKPCLPLHHEVSSFGGMSMTDTMSPTCKRLTASVPARRRAQFHNHSLSTARSCKTLEQLHICLGKAKLGGGRVPGLSSTQLFLRKKAQRAAGSLAWGAEGLWLNCSDGVKHLKKSSQVADLIIYYLPCPRVCRH